MVEITVVNSLPETPEIIRPLEIDDEVGLAKIAIRGDLCRFNKSDNPIVECFRAAEQDAREKDPKLLAITAGCPMYNPETGITECVFLPNMASCAKDANFEREFTKSVVAIKDKFERLLTKFFEKPEGYKAFLVRYELIDQIKEKGSTEYRIVAGELISQCNSSLKSFIIAHGVSLPKRRGIKVNSENKLAMPIILSPTALSEAIMAQGFGTC